MSATEENQARALGRWLDQPAGTPPPGDLDADVVEAMYALRPDLAQAPRVSADDILGSLTAGPLADAGRSATPAGGGAVGEVVPFPSKKPAPPEIDADAVRPGPARRGRFLVWAGVGGTGGIGLALVAAATLLLVAVPTLEQHEAAGPSPAPAAVSLPEEAAEAPAAPAAAPAPAPRPAAVARSSPPREMADGALFRDRQVIPEVEAPVADGRAGLAEAGAAADVPAEAEPAPVDLDAARARALPHDGGSRWQEGLDGDTRKRIQDAIEVANAARARGDLRTAADTLAAVVQPPASAGQYVAALAAQDYLGAGLPSAAVGVAQRGLGLSSENTAARASLLVWYGDALAHEGNVPGAADAYGQAERANATR